jgi:ABC-type transport system involved in cytochrome c biogenesis permease subunit
MSMPELRAVIPPMAVRRIRRGLWCGHHVPDQNPGQDTLAGILAMFPPDKVLDDLNYRAIMVGFPLLTLGIVTGAAWANYAWGT